MLLGLVLRLLLSPFSEALFVGLSLRSPLLALLPAPPFVLPRPKPTAKMRREGEGWVRVREREMTMSMMLIFVFEGYVFTTKARTK